MTSEEWEELALEVALALKTFDWARSDTLCERIAVAIRSDPSGAAAPVGRILKRLRRARRFQSMALLADAMFESGVASTESGVQYAQALTDTRSLSAAEAFLDWLSRRPDAASMASEIVGLRGRIAKQHHINTPDAQIDRAHRYLDESVRHYLAGFDLDRSVYFWHGINAVALIERAHRKGIPVDQFPASKALARSIVEHGEVVGENGRSTRCVEDRNGARSPHRPERFGAGRRCRSQVYSCRGGGCLSNRQHASPVDRGLGADKQCAARISGSPDVARGASCSRRWRFSSGATSSRRGSRGIRRAREGLRRRPV